ncbi:MAG TPA: DNA methyltransferase, partial [Deltaproteobacteria bacterium]|nr:DNA methyltransferase [Deltaproteobacteria bacterium]
TYASNFPSHPLHAWNLAGLKAERVRRLDADLWWMSPPCQPFTTRGLQRDVDDARCRPFLRIVQLIGDVNPKMVALENVPAFEGSRAHGLLLERLAEREYRVREGLLCPTELGVPNRRCRYYLVALRSDQPPLGRLSPTTAGWLELAQRSRRTRDDGLDNYLDPAPADDLYVDLDLVQGYRHALHIAEPGAGEPLSCFTSAYGRSMVRSGSYLQDSRGVRRFSPGEILRLLGFPDEFVFPSNLDTRKKWSLLGNSLSVDAVRAVLGCLPITPASPGP